MFGFLVTAALLIGQPATPEESPTTEAPAADAIVEGAATCETPKNCAPYAEAVAEEGADAAAASAEAAAQHLSAAQKNAVFVATMSDGDVMFARKETRRRSPGLPIGSTGIEMWFDIINYDHGGEEKQLWRFSCERRRLAPITRITYDADGKMIKRWKNEDAIRLFTGEDVIPDTVSEAMHSIACAND